MSRASCPDGGVSKRRQSQQMPVSEREHPKSIKVLPASYLEN